MTVEPWKSHVGIVLQSLLSALPAAGGKKHLDPHPTPNDEQKLKQDPCIQVRTTVLMTEVWDHQACTPFVLNRASLSHSGL